MVELAATMIVYAFVAAAVYHVGGIIFDIDGSRAAERRWRGEIDAPIRHLREQAKLDAIGRRRDAVSRRWYAAGRRWRGIKPIIICAALLAAIGSATAQPWPYPIPGAPAFVRGITTGPAKIKIIRVRPGDKMRERPPASWPPLPPQRPFIG